MADNGKWVPLATACELLKVSERTLRRHIKQEKYRSKMERGLRFVYVPPNLELADTDADMADENGGNSGHNGQANLSNQVINNTLLSELRAHLTEKERLVVEQIRHIDKLTDELREMRISASETSKRHDTIVMQLTQQLDRSQLQLEDLRQRRTVWQRLKAVFVAESA